MKKIISVPLLVLALLIFVPVINANNKEDVVLLETIEINPDFHELIELREEIIKLYEIDPQGTQFADFTPTCIAFIKANNDTYSKIRALDERGTPEDIKDINCDALIEYYRKFHVDASEYKEDISLSGQIENVTTASIGAMEEINFTFYEKVSEMDERKKHLELSMEESKGEILTLQRNYAILMNYSNSLALRQGLENTYFDYNKKLRNSMLISLVASTILGMLIGFIIFRKWKKRVEYLSLYTRKVMIMHPLVYACVITILVISLMLAYIYMNDAYSIFSYLTP
jgi:hypothetical protein